MGNLFATIPLPVLNGAGAAQDIHNMGGPKTLMCVGTFPGATITIENSVDGGVSWKPVIVFHNRGDQAIIPFACHSIRANVSGRVAGAPFTAACDVMGPEAAFAYDTIPLPATVGNGTPLDTTAFQNFVTINCTGPIDGSIAVQISRDGNTWSTLTMFTDTGGSWSGDLTAAQIRTKVSNALGTAQPAGVVVSIGSYAAPTQSSSGGGATFTVLPIDPVAIVASETDVITSDPITLAADRKLVVQSTLWVQFIADAAGENATIDVQIVRDPGTKGETILARSAAIVASLALDEDEVQVTIPCLGEDDIADEAPHTYAVKLSLNPAPNPGTDDYNVMGGALMMVETDV